MNPALLLEEQSAETRERERAIKTWELQHPKGVIEMVTSLQPPAQPGRTVTTTQDDAAIERRKAELLAKYGG